MRSWITSYDEELVHKARQFSDAADANPQSRAVLEQYGFTAEERERGRHLIRASEGAFAAERDGTAWNFLSPTRERRREEAKAWYRDTRLRHLRGCVRSAEEESGWVGEGAASRWPVGRKLTWGTLLAVRHLARVVSPRAWLEHRAQLALDLRRADEERPEGAPPPKDTALVELSGWYERWRLLAQRVFRERPDLMKPYGLVPGKAPPRLRGRAAQLKYGEKAAGSLGDAAGPDRETLRAGSDTVDTAAPPAAIEFGKKTPPAA